jgi:hypothetical protein
MLFGRKLLHHGVRWGVEDGKAIRIFSDHWIPNIPPLFLKPVSLILANTIVHSLINEEIGASNEETVRVFFSKETAASIFQD